MSFYMETSMHIYAICLGCLKPISWISLVLWRNPRLQTQTETVLATDQHRASPFLSPLPHISPQGPSSSYLASLSVLYNSPFVFNLIPSNYWILVSHLSRTMIISSLNPSRTLWDITLALFYPASVLVPKHQQVIYVDNIPALLDCSE